MSVLQQLSDEHPMWDVCVVGTGPVGMAIALEFDRLGREVLLIESGDTAINPALEEASHAEFVNPQHHAPMEITVCRALGGTSWAWGGRSLPLDDVDWVPRDFVTDAHWPIGEEVIRGWFDQAAEYLLCGSGDFVVPFKQQLTGGLRFDCVERWAWQRQLILQHRSRIMASERIKLSLNSTLTSVNLDPAGHRVASLTVSTPQGIRTVRARRVVLAMGGVEGTRILLHAQQRFPASFGGVDGPLGRYYMGHVSGKIATVQFTEAVSFEDVDFRRGPQGSYYRRRITLSKEEMLRRKLMNFAFWTDNPNFYDPSHRSCALSAIYLALAFKALGRRLTSEGIRQAQVGPGGFPLSAHIRNLILGAPQGVADLFTILRDRFLIKPPKPLFLVPHPNRRYYLSYSSEPAPSANSRITLSTETDSFGVPRALIDLRFSQHDLQNVIDAHDAVNELLQANRLGRIEYVCPREKLLDEVSAYCKDGYHQVGTTRMGADPTQSVVDSNLKAHGVENLYIASSSVFPIAGQANSTFMAAAFGVRLVHHLVEN